MSVSCECCVLSDKGLWDGPIPHPEKSYRVCVSECDHMQQYLSVHLPPLFKYTTSISSCILIISMALNKMGQSYRLVRPRVFPFHGLGSFLYVCHLITLSIAKIIQRRRYMTEWIQRISEIFWQGKIVPVPLCPSQIPHGLVKYLEYRSFILCIQYSLVSHHAAPESIGQST
jgi:hypothetical protein